jgi:hypothetical protein
MRMIQRRRPWSAPRPSKTSRVWQTLQAALTPRPAQASQAAAFRPVTSLPALPALRVSPALGVLRALPSHRASGRAGGRAWAFSTRRPSRLCWTLALLALATATLLSATAWAQGPVVDPGGEQPSTAAPNPVVPAQPPQRPTTVIIPINPQTGQPTGQAVPVGADGLPLPTGPQPVNPDGFYHYDGYDQGMGAFDQPSTAIHAGPTPELHVVRSGDTLWDLCFYYFNDPWQWPKVWSYNAQITNPHWIYPGDLVRMVPRGVFASTDGAPELTEVSPAASPTDPRPAPARRIEVSLRQTAFVEREALEPK